MRPQCLGPESDRAYIKKYLDNILTLDPIEIATVPLAVTLADERTTENIIDKNLFQEIIEKSLERLIAIYGIIPVTLQPERYYIAEPTDTTSVGGFHDQHSVGYQYWFQAAFVMTLNSQLASKEIRTIELARSFLHDCLHHSTFVSFRRIVRLPDTNKQAKHRTPEIYREQYGINFRNKAGLSYSAPSLTKTVPAAINLNLWMDGAVVLAVADVMKDIVSEPSAATFLEAQLVKEIFLEPFDISLLPRENMFSESIIAPTKKFIDHWGGKDFLGLTLRAMLSGDLNDIKLYFDRKTQSSGAWERLFKQAEFELETSLQPEIQ